MATINKALAVLAALAFFLPFITISCNGTALVEVSGAKLAQCSIRTCSAQDIVSPDVKRMARGNIPDINVPTPGRPGQVSDFDGANFVLYAAIACVVAALALFFAGRPGELISGLASVASIVLLFMFRSKFTDAVAPHLQSQSPGMNVAAAIFKMQLQFSAGFWISMIVSAVSAILALKGTAKTRSTVAPGGPSSLGGSSQQPPVGH